MSNAGTVVVTVSLLYIFSSKYSDITCIFVVICLLFCLADSKKVCLVKVLGTIINCIWLILSIQSAGQKLPSVPAVTPILYSPTA